MAARLLCALTTTTTKPSEQATRSALVFRPIWVTVSIGNCEVLLSKWRQIWPSWSADLSRPARVLRSNNIAAWYALAYAECVYVIQTQ